jgi:tripartite-type tricarboxylate transporter receptor subunit TctC
MRNLAVVMALAAGFGTLASAEAQIYPSRPVTLTVPPLAGGTADALARVFAGPMSKSLGQPVVVKRIGELDSAGYSLIPRGAPDGYTVEIGNLDSYRYTMYGKSYDFMRNLMPVALLPSVPAWIVARKMPAADLQGLVAWLRVNSDKAPPGRLGSGTPGKASVGIVGSGTSGHICGIDLQGATGARIQFVPYWGNDAMLRGLARGQIDLVCSQATDSLAMVRGGEIKAYAVMAKTRWFAMPDIPTGGEMGLPGIYASSWHGFWVPAGTPHDIIARLNAAAVYAMADPEVHRRIADEGMEIPARDQQSPAALDALQRAETAKWCEAMAGRAGPYLAVLPLCGGRRAEANGITGARTGRDAARSM